jgi:RING finger/CHY zinc finger protein 1
LTNMKQHWKRMDLIIREWPMPGEYASVICKCLCNDCGEFSQTPFHIHGLKCQKCGGYNTRRE